MAKIIQLSEDVIAKIAAGEVIERPVYAVKELVENAIDAHATSIIVHIEQSGLQTIVVIDDGDGMSKEDLEMSVRPHATSKLLDEETLSHIATLGFRGEALSSIAAISEVVISTKREEDTLGTSIRLRGGMVESITPIGLPNGTHVTVSQLFSSVPARKKFLKSEKTEFRHITDLIIQYALAHPQIRFVLTHNGKQLFDLPLSSTTGERVQLLLGEEVYRSLVQLKYEDSYTTISGHIAKPQTTTKSGQKQYLFVNNRRVSDKLVSQAVKDAFGTMLDSLSYPVFVLFLSLPYELVDVNVHPRKEQVRFVHSQLVYDAIRKAVGEVLANNNITYHTSLWEEDEDRPISRKGIVQTYAGQLLKETVLPWDVRSLERIPASDLLQLHNVYLVTSTTHGIVLIDQHAAHERILYEQFLKEFLSQKKKQTLFHLSKPLSLDLSLVESDLVEEHKELFHDLGFEIEHFGNTAYLITAVPLLFRDRDLKQLFAEFLDDLKEEKDIKNLDIVSKRMISYLACRIAIMAGEKLTKGQMKELVEKLETTPNNVTCPHGRPTKISVSLDRLHRLFKRK